MSNKWLNRRDFLSQAMEEETWYNKRGKDKQQRDRQEFILRAPMQDFASRQKHVEDTEEMARNKQRAREKMSEGMKKVDEDKTAKSIWGLSRNDQKRVVVVKEGGQERGWTPRGRSRNHGERCECDCWEMGELCCALSHDKASERNTRVQENVVTPPVLAPGSSDGRTLRKVTIVRGLEEWCCVVSHDIVYEKNAEGQEGNR